jgi:hypothetical protein
MEKEKRKRAFSNKTASVVHEAISIFLPKIFHIKPKNLILMVFCDV